MTDQEKVFNVGQRVYCPTYGHYGVIADMDDEKATVTLIGAYGIGQVSIKHGAYELPKYQVGHDIDQAVHSQYEVYCESVWGKGGEALTYHDWLQQQFTEMAPLKAALKPFAAIWDAWWDREVINVPFAHWMKDHLPSRKAFEDAGSAYAEAEGKDIPW